MMSRVVDIKEPLVVVSGFPRSGTSLVMQMLNATGFPIYTDGKRSADDANIHGYFEHESVKDLKTDNNWIFGLNHCAIKVVSPFLKYLPYNKFYKVIYVTRPASDVVESEDRMLDSYGVTPSSGKGKRIKQTKDHVNNVLCEMRYWNIRMMIINYNDIRQQPLHAAKRICSFINEPYKNQIEKAASVVR